MRLLPRCSPKYATRRRPERQSFGGELTGIGAALGQPFMPHQREIAEVGGEIDGETGLPAYRTIIVTVPRQTGKTTLFLVFQIHRCTSPRWAHPQRSAFTAQSGKDARDKWMDELFPLIRRSRVLKPLVARIYEGMGNEYIRFTNGSLIRLLSTSASSGHSKTLHQAVLDEIWHDTDSRRQQALGPAMITIADAQVLICSTAGTDASVVLDRQIEMGRAAALADSGHGTAYFEYSAPDGWDPDDEDSYYGFMPALCPAPPCRCGGGQWRHTITIDAIRSERASMEAAEFARAYGNIPDRSGQRAGAGFAAAWAAGADPRSQISGPVALAFAVESDESPWAGTWSVAVAGRRPDGLGHGELTEPPHQDTAGLVDRLCVLADRHDPCVLVMNPAGAAGAFQKELIERGFAVVTPGKEPPPGKRRLQIVGAREYAQACGALSQDVANGRWRHLGQGPLDDAAGAAKTRALADAWAWSWRGATAPVSPLEAVTLARHGFMTHGVTEPPSPFALWG
jgi:hypothetical protein